MAVSFGYVSSIFGGFFKNILAQIRVDAGSKTVVENDFVQLQEYFKVPAVPVSDGAVTIRDASIDELERRNLAVADYRYATIRLTDHTHLYYFWLISHFAFVV
jgi:hypothetical protein